MIVGRIWPKILGFPNPPIFKRGPGGSHLAIGFHVLSQMASILDYVLSRPIVSAAMIAGELKITPRAAQDLVGEFGLREATGRGRYRAWGIL